VIDQNGTTRLFTRDSQGRLTDANGVVHNPVKLWTDNGFVNTVHAPTVHRRMLRVWSHVPTDEF